MATVSTLQTQVQPTSYRRAHSRQRFAEFKPAATQHDITTPQYARLLSETIDNFGLHDRPTPKPCNELKDRIHSRIKDVTPHQRLASKVSQVAALVVTHFYPSHSEQIQYVIGLYTAAYLVLDDTGHSMIDDIRLFRQRLTRNEPQPALFELLVYIFDEFDKHFPSFVANKLVSGVLTSLSSLEIEFDKSSEFAASTSEEFPKYFRNMNGSSEAYVYFLLTADKFGIAHLKRFLGAVPELWNITDEINDLMSFYKESLVGTEDDTYVYNQANAEGKSVLEVLQGLSTQILQRSKTLGHIFADDPLLQEYVEQYVSGQVRFYLTSERYRLSELNLM